MGLYDFLVKYKLDYNNFVQMIYDLNKFVYVDTEYVIKETDELYDNKEFEDFLLEYKDYKARIERALDWFKFHSKNLTKEQEYVLESIREIIKQEAQDE